MQRITATVRLALLKISVDAPHLICHMSKTQNALLSDSRERIERSSLHFDRHQFALDHCINRRLRFTKWRIGGPGRAGENRNGKCLECALKRRDQSAICM